MARKSVGLIHNIPSPYRLPVFQELSNECDLTVFFTATNHNNRYWTPNLSEYSFDYVLLNSLKISKFYFSLSMFYYILSNDYDKIVISENPPTIFITVISICAGKICGSEIVVWNEAWNEDIFSGIEDMTKTDRLIQLGASYSIKGYRRLLYATVDDFVAFSQMAKEYLMDLGVNSENIYTSHQIIPVEELPEPRTNDKIKYAFNDNKTSYLYFGYIRPGKGIEVLLDSFKKLQEDHTDCELIIAGSGEHEYEKKIKTIGRSISDVRFLGYIEEQKGTCYANADVVVLPTYRDAWGLVINESLYYETPIITTGAAAGKEIVNGRGIIIPPGDRTALTCALKMHLSDEEGNHCKVCNSGGSDLTSPKIMSDTIMSAVKS